MYWKNYLGYLGLLGLVGFTGFAGNYYLFGFFGFFVYLGYFRVIPDELFKENVRKAAAPGFFVSIATSTIFTGYSITLQGDSAEEIASTLATGLALNFALPIFVFTGILLYCEFGESIGD